MGERERREKVGGPELLFYWICAITARLLFWTISDFPSVDSTQSCWKSIAMAETEAPSNAPTNKRPHSAVTADENGESRRCSSFATSRGLLTMRLDRRRLFRRRLRSSTAVGSRTEEETTEATIREGLCHGAARIAAILEVAHAQGAIVICDRHTIHRLRDHQLD